MRVDYLRLENVAGLVVGSKLNYIEIDFTKSKNKIISIQGRNGLGKTVLLSSISPFAGVTGLDDRSSLSYITPGKNGYKEIHYREGNDRFIIKHYFKASKETHTVKSHFAMNGRELNENGNVTSFLSLVEFHFGLTQEMMRLVRLGTNVNSFISLTPARRKEYIGKLIEEIDLYLKIYKKVNEDSRIVKVLMGSNAQNLYNCHISDLVIEQERLAELQRELGEKERERDQLVAKIGKIAALEQANNINELRKKKQEAEASLYDFEKTESNIKEERLEGVNVDQLIKRRGEIIESRIEAQSKINSYRISTDNTRKSIERLETSIRKVNSENDIQSLLDAVESTRMLVKSTSDRIVKMIPPTTTSDEVYQLLSSLSSFNQISQMIHTFGDRPTKIYLKLRRDGKSVDSFLKDQTKLNLSRMNSPDIKRLFDQVFGDDQIITPNCDTEWEHCPFHRFFEMISEFKDRMEEETYDDETLRYVQVISNNIDNMLNQIDRLRQIKIPEALKEIMREKEIMNRLDSKLAFFELTEISVYLSMIREWEVYVQNVERLKQYEQQLSLYKSSGIDQQIAEINQLGKDIEFYNNNITTLTSSLATITEQLETIDRQIGLVTKYIDGKKYKKIIQSTLDATNKVLSPLENSANERVQLGYQLDAVKNRIGMLRIDEEELKNKLNEYARLQKEAKKLQKKHKDLDMIQKSVSTRKGIPVFYMNLYLGKIQKLANALLEIIYEDEFKLAKFNVDQEIFEIPYIKDGVKVSDVKYASQSELALATLALSFALSNRASGAYNILLLDEMDAGLDETNRASFLRMLDRQMRELYAEQVIIISHSLNHMLNVPMDVIRLSDLNIRSKLQNVIYE